MRRKAWHFLQSRTSQGHCSALNILDVINKSDGAHSVTVPKKKATGQAEIRSAPEESPPAEPSSNGHVKSAGTVRSVFQFGKTVYVHLAILPCPKWQGTACKPWVHTSQVSRSSRCDSGPDNSRCCEVKADSFRFEKYQDRIEDLRSLFWSTQTSEALMEAVVKHVIPDGMRHKQGP